MGGGASTERMTKKTPRSTSKALALLLIGTSCLAGCDAEDESVEGDDPTLSDQELDETLEDEPIELEAALLDAIAAAPELLDEDVEALFANDQPTLRDVISLVDIELLPADLTLEDLDLPIVLELSEPPAEDQGNNAAGDFAVETDPQFSGEQACATTNISNPDNGATVWMSPPPACSYDTDGATSPNTSYGPTGCPHQFVTEVRGTSGRPLSFYSAWRGISLNETYCELSSMGLSAYGGRWQVGYIGGTMIFSLQWTKIGTTRQYGEWSSGGWFPQCSWQYDTGYGPLPTLSSGHNYSRVRTAAQGFVFALFPFKQRVEAGVSHGSGPC